MPEPDKPSIFRQASLARLSSPERIDQLMIVVPLRDWIPLGLLAGCAAALLAWSVAGQVPIAVTGRGAFVAARATGDAPPVVAYFTIGDGKRIRPGMRVQVTPDTVKREEYGGLLGEVTGVTEQPVAFTGALNVVENEVVARQLTDEGRAIEVFIQPLRDPNGAAVYQWTGLRGSGLPITPGTTGAVRVTLERRAPISFLLPILRQISGLG